MSQNSAEIIGADSKYLEIRDGQVIGAIRQGSTNEDSTSGIEGARGPWHFYNPATGTGLDVLHLPNCAAGCFNSALNESVPIWKNAITSYQLLETNKLHAYEIVGHVLHLVTQDMAQPSHVHNDPHLPHINGWGDSSTIDIDTWLTNGLFPLNVTGIHGGGFLQPEDFGQAVAELTHNFSRFPGTLNLISGTGQINLPNNVTYFPVFHPIELGGPLPLRNRWIITTPQQKKLRYFPSIVEDGSGVFDDALAQDWWRVRESPTLFYFDKQGDVQISSSENLDLWLIRRFAPLGIQYGAGLLKLFHDIVKPPPYIKDILISDGTQEIYSSHVTPSTQASLLRDKNVVGNPSFRFNRPYTVSVTYNEPMDNPSFQIGSINTNLSQPHNNPDGSQTWTGSFSIPQPAEPPPPGQQCRDPMNLVFGGVDIYNHLIPNGGGIVQGIGLDLDPTTIARRDPNTIDNGTYQWLGYDPNSSGLSGENFSFPCGCSASGPDTTPPTVSLDAPTETCSINNTVTVTGNASDNCELQSVTVNGVPAVVDSVGNFTVLLTLPEGNNTITAHALDRSNNSADSAPIQIKVDSLPPQLQSTLPPSGALNISVNSVIALAMTENLSEGRLQILGTPVGGTSNLVNNTITYTHAALPPNATFVARATEIRDQCGNAGADQQWVFSTAAFESLPDDLSLPGEQTFTNDAQFCFTGYVKNPNGPAQIQVCAQGLGPCQNFSPGPSPNTPWSACFPVPQGFEIHAKTA